MNNSTRTAVCGAAADRGVACGLESAAVPQHNARATAVGPAVVKNDIVVAYVSETGGEEYAGGIEEKGLRDIAAERVPVVPAHLRCSSEAIINS